MIKLNDILKEVITIPVEIGDVILTGKFKNKPVVIKSIELDDHGMPTVNGKYKACTFRIKKQVNIFDEEKNKWQKTAKYMWRELLDDPVEESKKNENIYDSKNFKWDNNKKEYVAKLKELKEKFFPKYIGLKESSGNITYYNRTKLHKDWAEYKTNDNKKTVIIEEHHD